MPINSSHFSSSSYLSESEWRDLQLRYLVRPLLDEHLVCLAQRARDLRAAHAPTQTSDINMSTCTLCYAWPLSDSSDVNERHSRILVLHDDLTSAGIRVLYDLGNFVAVYAKDNTLTLTKWFKESLAQSTHALLLNSDAYEVRREDDATITAQLHQQLVSLKGNEPGFIIPILWSGKTFPTGFTSTLGAVMNTSASYYEQLPPLAAKLLGLQDDADWQAMYRRYKERLKYFTQQVKSLGERDVLAAQFDKEQQDLGQRLDTLIGTLTRSQRILLDGNLQSHLRQLRQRIEALARTMPICINGSKLSATIIGFERSPHWDECISKRVNAFMQREAGASIDTTHMALNSAKVLVLTGAQSCNKRDWLRLAERRAWQDWLVDGSSARLPIYVDISQAGYHPEKFLEQALERWGLVDEEITLIKQAVPCMVFVDGLSADNLVTNSYVRQSLSAWDVKVLYRYVDTVSNTLLKTYFVPSDVRGHADEAGLQWLAIDATKERRVSLDLSLGHWQGPGVSQPSVAGALLPIPGAVANLSANLPAAEPVSSNVSASIVRTAFQTHSAEQACALQYLQKLRHQAALTTLFEGFLARYKKIKAVNDHLQIVRQAFISYAWPDSKEDTYTLQTRLQRVVADFEAAGIKVLLDIEQLALGKDIDTFMQQGIEVSEAILLIGTPKLKKRIMQGFSDSGLATYRDADGVVRNNVAFEFDQIRTKHAQQWQAWETSPVYGLCFEGQPDESFPSDVLAPFDRAQRHDFSDETTYFATLPSLCLHMLSLQNDNQSQQALADYMARYHQHNDFSDVEIDEAVVQAQAAQRQHVQTLNQLFDEAKAQGQNLAARFDRNILTSSLEQLAQGCDANQAQGFYARELTKYVPVHATRDSSDKPSEDDVFDLWTYLNGEVIGESPSITPTKMTLLLGASGAGKSLFLRLYEQRRWQAALSRLQGGADADAEASPSGIRVIPLLINLSQSGALDDALIERALRAKGLSTEAIDVLRDKVVIELLLDGLDEVAHTHLHRDCFLASASLRRWRIYQIIIGCRREQLPAITTHLRMLGGFNDVMDYFSDSARHFNLRQEMLYLTVFNPEQIEQFIEQFIKTPDATWRYAAQYKREITSLSGLSELIKTPFILNMVCLALPSLVQNQRERQLHRQRVTRAEVYDAFLMQWFTKAFWRHIITDNHPVHVDLAQQWRAFCMRIASTLLKRQQMSMTLDEAFVGINEEAMRFTLKACPLSILDAGGVSSLSFIHRSVLEFAASLQFIEWLRKPFTERVRLWKGTALLREASVLHFMNDMLMDDDEVLLWELVYATRKYPSLGPIAAIAITLLNLRGVSFSRLDLSGIAIPGADMSFSVCQETNFSDADLTDVNFEHSYLVGTCFECARMSGSYFSESRGVFIPLMALKDAQDKLLKTTKLSQGYLRLPNQDTVVLLDADAQGNVWLLFMALDDGCITHRVNTQFSCAEPELIASSDGERLALCGKQAIETIVLSGRSGEVLKRFAGMNKAIFSPKDEVLLLTGESEMLVVLAQTFRECLSGAGGPYTSEFTREGEFLTLRGTNESIIFSVVEQKEVLRSVKEKFFLSPSGKLLVLSSKDQTKVLSLHETNVMSLLAGKQLTRQADEAKDVAFIPNDQVLIMAFSLWSMAISLRDNKLLVSSEMQMCGMLYKCFSPNGELFVMPTVNKQFIIKAESALEPVCIQGGGGGRLLAFNSNGEWIVLSDWGKTKVFSTRDGKHEKASDWPEVTDASFSSDSKLLLLFGGYYAGTVVFLCRAWKKLVSFGAFGVLLEMHSRKQYLLYDKQGVHLPLLIDEQDGSVLIIPVLTIFVLYDQNQLFLFTRHQLYQWDFTQQQLHLITSLSGAVVHAAFESFGSAKRRLIVRMRSGFYCLHDVDMAHHVPTRLIERARHELPITACQYLNAHTGLLKGIGEEVGELLTWHVHKCRFVLSTSLLPADANCHGFVKKVGVSGLMIFISKGFHIVLVFNRDGELLTQLLRVHKYHISPSKKFLVLIGYRATESVILFKEDRKVVHMNLGVISEVVFSPNETLMVLVGEDKNVVVFPLREDKEIMHFAGIDRLRQSLDGRKFLLTGDKVSETVLIVEDQTQATIHVFQGGFAEVTFSPNSRRLVVTTARYQESAIDGLLISCQEGRVLAIIPDCGKVDFSPEGKIFVLIDTHIKKIYSSENGHELARFDDYNLNIVNFISGGKQLVLTGENARATLVLDEAGAELARVPDFNSVTFSPDGKCIALTGRKSEIAILLSGESGAELARISDCNSVTFSPDSKCIALTGRKPKIAILLSGESGAELTRIYVSDCDTATFSPDGKWMVLAGCGAYETILLSGKTGSELARIPNDPGDSFVTLYTIGNLIVLLVKPSKLIIFSQQAIQALARIKFKYLVTSVIFDRDDVMIVEHFGYQIGVMYKSLLLLDQVIPEATLVMGEKIISVSFISNNELIVLFTLIGILVINRKGIEFARAEHATDVAFDANNDLMVLAGESAPEALIFSIKQRKVLARLHLLPTKLCLFTPNKAWLICYNEADTKHYNAQPASIIHFSSPADWYHVTVFHGKAHGVIEQAPFGRYIVLCGTVTRIYFIDQEKFIELPCQASSALVLNEGGTSQMPARIVTSHQDCTLRLWDVTHPAHPLLLNATFGMDLTIAHIRLNDAKNLSTAQQSVLGRNMIDAASLADNPSCEMAIPAERIDVLSLQDDACVHNSEPAVTHTQPSPLEQDNSLVPGSRCLRIVEELRLSRAMQRFLDTQVPHQKMIDASIAEIDHALTALRAAQREINDVPTRPPLTNDERAHRASYKVQTKHSKQTATSGQANSVVTTIARATRSLPVSPAQAPSPLNNESHMVGFQHIHNRLSGGGSTAVMDGNNVLREPSYAPIPTSYFTQIMRQRMSERGPSQHQDTSVVHHSKSHRGGNF